MSRRPLRKLNLSFQHLEDRLAPSASPPAGLIVAPEYWRESKFIPVQTTPAEDGGAWVIGTTQTAGRYSWWGPWNNDWAVVKLTASGTIDPTFNNGKVKDLDTGLLDWFRILDIRTDSDGKLYVLGRNIARDPLPLMNVPAGTNPLYSGYEPATGKTSIVPGTSTVGLATSLDAVAGCWYSPFLPPPVDAPAEEFSLVRINADGSFDSSFDADGMALFDLDTRTDRPMWVWSGHDARLALGADGTAIVASVQGETYPTPSNISVNVARFTSDGSLDSTFDGDGRAQLSVPLGTTFDSSSTGQLVGLALTAEGDIVLGGSINVWYTIQGEGLVESKSYSGLFAARLTASGAADTTFDSDGVAIVTDTAFGETSGLTINQFALSSNEEPLFVGTKYPLYYPTAIYPAPQLNDAFVVRMTAAGSLDTFFDGDGILYPNFLDRLEVTSADRIVPLADGSFFFAGQESELLVVQEGYYPTITTNFVVAKFQTDGTLDNSFTPLRQTPANYGAIHDLDLLTDNRLLAVSGYPQQLMAIDADGKRAVSWTVPYYRVGPWQPPPDFVPFPGQPAFRSDTGDLNGDGVDDYVYGTGSGSVTKVRVVNGQTGVDLVSDFQPYEARFRGGMFIGTGDFDGDGNDDLVVSPDVGGSARVQVFAFANGYLVQKANFFAIRDANFRGGGSIAVADTNGDGTPDLAVGAAKGGSQRIATFDGKTLFGRHSLPPVLFGDYFAPLPGVDPATYRGGVDLRSEDVDGDGDEEIVMFPAVGGPGVALFDSMETGLRFQALANGITPSGADLFLEWP